MYEFYVDKQIQDINNKNPTSNNMHSNKVQTNKSQNITKIKFNSYGNEFSVLTEEGNINLFDFEPINNRQTLPKLTLESKMTSSFSTKSLKDFLYIGNSGLIATSSIDSNRLNVFSNSSENYYNEFYIWDILLPLDKASVINIKHFGGNILEMNKANSNYIVVGNNHIGSVSFVDIRKSNEVYYSFEAHKELIRSMVVSDSGNFIATSSTDGYIKIWDISNRNEVNLIESIVPYVKISNSKKIDLHLKQGYLFSAGSNSIKLIRNNLN